MPKPTDPKPANPNAPVPVDSEPFDLSAIFLEPIYGGDFIDYIGELSGKAKTIAFDDGRELVLAPGQKLTITNDVTDESVTLNITGSFHKTFNEDGTTDWVATGRNLLGDPFILDGQPGLVLVTGRFTFTTNTVTGELVEALSGTGTVTDIRDLLP
jgi:hypothetical protein